MFYQCSGESMSTYEKLDNFEIQLKVNTQKFKKKLKSPSEYTIEIYHY